MTKHTPGPWIIHPMHSSRTGLDAGWKLDYPWHIERQMSGKYHKQAERAARLMMEHKGYVVVRDNALNPGLKAGQVINNLWNQYFGQPFRIVMETTHADWQEQVELVRKLTRTRAKICSGEDSAKFYRAITD